MIRKHGFLIFIILLLSFIVIGGACGLMSGHTLTITIVGEGQVADLEEGENRFLFGDSTIELEALPNQDWKFYAWAGKSRYDVNDLQGKSAKIFLDEDKEITAWFIPVGAEKMEIEITVQTFLGAKGEASDVTGHPPYPAGFEVDLKATPKDETKYTFLNWTTTVGDPREFFLDHEASETTFYMPDLEVIGGTNPIQIRPYFTTITPPVEKGDFQYNQNDLGSIITGEYGVTVHYWDLSQLETGDKLNFYFHARTIPDRFNVHYGKMDDWDDLEGIFASGWVSHNPSNWEDPSMYPEGIEFHDWHENVELKDWNPNWYFGRPGGKYKWIIEKESGKDVLMIRIEGRDEGTIWDYKFTIKE